MLHQIEPEKHGPLGQPMAKAIEACVHCGFCLAACPTYQELGQEMDSPRGRILLMKDVLEGTLEAKEIQDHVDLCLGCLACEPACPSGVPYRDLISPFRALNAKGGQSLAHRLQRKLTESTLPYPKRLRPLAKLGSLMKPLAPLGPRSLAPMLDLLPDKVPAKQTYPMINKAKGECRSRVALLTGCAQQVLDPDINRATIEVLTHNGVEVVIPEDQACCGALSWHVGNLPQAQAFAKTNLAAFPHNIDAIISNAAGCGSGMKEYHLILKGTEHEEQAKQFEARVQDVTAFLCQLGDLEPVGDSDRPLRIAYHDACHLSNGQGVTAQPRQLLQQIPGAEVLEIPEGHLCCGSAGTYNIEQPAIAASLGRQKAEHILSLKPDLVAAGNIGCLTQINHHLATLGSDLRARHTVQILRDAYTVA